MKGSKVLLILIVIMLAGCDGTFSYIEGLDYFNQKNYDAAIAKFKTAVNMEPSNANYQFHLGFAYHKNNQFAEAIPHLKKAAELKPDSDNYRWLGRAYLGNKQYQEAIDSAKRAMELKPSRPDLEIGCWATMAWSYEALGQIDSAIAAVNNGINVDPNDPEGYVFLAYLRYQNGQYDEAITAAKMAIELQPDARAYNNLGLAYSRKGEYDAAIESYNKGIEINANLVTLHTNLGDAYTLKKEFSEAAQAFNKAVELEPNNVGNILLLALSYYNIGRYDDALSAVNKTISLQVKTAKKETEAAISFGIRGAIYRAKGNSDEAMKDAEKAMSLDGDNFWARFSYGRACLDRGSYDDAAKVLEGETKWELPALNARWLIAKATLYAKQGKMKESLDAYLEISEEDISPENVPLWNDRKVLLQTLKPLAQAHRENAEKFEAQGRFQEALDELAGALTLAMDDKEADEVRNSIFQMVRRIPQPLEMSEDACKYALRGEILIKEGEREGAISEIKKAIRLAPFSARLYFNAALIYGELKNYSEAIRYMKIYLQAAPDAPNARAAKDEIIKWELQMERGE
jgi:tetratricopeptide (TPR) repeat protein